MTDTIWTSVPTRDASGGIWYKVSSLEPRQIKMGRINLWTALGNQPGGMWHELEDETILLDSRERRDIWEEVNDETLIIRPRRNIWQEFKLKPILKGYHPGLWAELSEETLIISQPKVSEWSRITRIEDFTHYKPNRRLGWALKQLETAGGTEYFVLKNMRAGTYLRLTKEQVFLWNLMDGQHTIQDLVVEFFIHHKTLAIQGLLDFLVQLEAKGFLIEPRINLYNRTADLLGQGRLSTLAHRLQRAFTQTTISISGIDRLLTVVYRSGVFLLFKWPVQLLMLIITFAGLVAFGYFVQIGTYSVIIGGGEHLALGVVCLYLVQFLAVLLHEASHAFTCKHYGREVRRAGFIIYLGMPAFFVDTTDVWMEPRKPRLLVSLAGPYSGFFLAAVASLLIYISPSDFVSGLLYQFAFVNNLLSFANLNPLLKLDGYYILMDWLEMPMLRARALQFVQGELWNKIRLRHPFEQEDKIFAIYGLLSLVWTVIIILLSLRLFGAIALNFFQNLLGSEIGLAMTGLLAIGLAVILLWPYFHALTTGRRKTATTLDNRIDDN